MITLTNDKLDTIVWTAKRKLRNLKEAFPERELIESYVEIIETGRKADDCGNSVAFPFLKLNTNLNLFKIRNVRLRVGNAAEMTCLLELKNQTEILDDVTFEYSEASSGFSTLDLQRWAAILASFKEITRLHFKGAVDLKSTEVLAKVPCRELTVDSAQAFSHLAHILTMRKDLEVLQIDGQCAGSSAEFYEVIKEHPTIRV